MPSQVRHFPSSPIVTGIGLCTPLGVTVERTWDALCAGKFITDHASVPDLNCGRQPRVSYLAFCAVSQALRESRWSAEEISSAGLIVATSKGPVEPWLEQAAELRSRAIACRAMSFAQGRQGSDEDANRKYPQSSPYPNWAPAAAVPRGIADGHLSEPAAVVARELKIHGPKLTISAACASGLVALIRATMMIRAGQVHRAVVVAAESSLHPLFLASFQRLGVIPPSGFGCRPFDLDRRGFVVSEASAAICLEANNAGGNRHAPTVAVDGFALGADATHLTGSDPDGRTLRRIMRTAFDHRPLDLIHAHGTGTLANDPIELAAIKVSLLRPDEPDVMKSHAQSSAADEASRLKNRPNLYSHKGALGHSLGASGLMSVVINCLCHRHGKIPPNVQTRQPLESPGIIISPGLAARHVRRSAAIAAGFGGAIAAVSIRSL